MQSQHSNNSSAPRRSWTKPEIIGIAAASNAKIGNNSMTIDQGFPAANGTVAHFS